MNRYATTFILLTALGGCTTFDRDADPVDDYLYGSPQRSTARTRAWPPANSGWSDTASRDTASRSRQTVSTDLNTDWYSSRPSRNKLWTSGQQRATAARQNTSSGQRTATATAAKPKPAPRYTTAKGDDDKSEDTLIKTAYPNAKGGERYMPPQLTPKVAAAKTTPIVASQADTTTPAPPVNLGVLHLLNSKRVTFRYEVKDPAAAGIADLELWGTTDMRQWRRYDIVKRSSSSLVVDVKDEGLYGFTMIARGKDELSQNQPPRPGEPPQVWVAVDRTKPVVQLLGAELNIMARTPALVIRWDAKDRNFSSRPITLLYSERLEGPWTPIAANVENSGRYEWVMTPYSPANMYVRVQAVDLMGNMGMAQTTMLHIPNRSSAASSQTPDSQLDGPPPRVKSSYSQPYETDLRPVAANLPNPAVSILSVEGE